MTTIDLTHKVTASCIHYDSGVEGFGDTEGGCFSNLEAKKFRLRLAMTCAEMQSVLQLTVVDISGTVGLAGVVLLP